MIEKDEEIINSLEELDSTFSQINKVLRLLRCKVEAVEAANKSLIRGCNTWCNFFGIKKAQKDTTAEHHAQDAHHSFETQSVLKPSSPVNPFHRRDEASDEKLLPTEMTFGDDNSWINDTEASELVDFSQQLLPEGFKEIDEIKMIYYFVQQHGAVAVDEVYERFSDISRELMNIFLDMLIRKNFIRWSENKLIV
jgi:hypothetical protein